MSILKPAKILGAGGGGNAGVKSVNGQIPDANGNVIVTAAEMDALGNTGDQVLDGELTVTYGLTIRSPNQTSANVVSFFFGENDGVLDASIKATATADNKGQMALGVRDDTGNVINALTIDGNGKSIIIQPGYKVYVGNSSVDISGITPFGMQVLECKNAAELGALMGIFPEALLNKIKPENNTNLGSETVLGNVLPTTTTPYPILTVVNTWLTVPLTADELTLILNNREQFIFEMGVGDRREANKSRFTLIDNWHGADVSGLLLTPDPYPDQPYKITLTFNGAAGNLVITDTHSDANKFGAIRSFTIRKAGAN